MKMKKIVALVCSLTLTLSLLSGCGTKEDPSKSPDSKVSDTSSVEVETPTNLNPVGEYPIVDEPITFKVMGSKDPGAPDWGELEVFKRLEEQTNIKLEFELYETSNFAEKKNIALVGGTYADIILRGADKNDEETYGPQGRFIDLTDLIENYAPNIKKLLNERPDVKAAITAMDGKIYGLPYVFDTATTQGHTAFFDSEWMKNVGIDKVPETTDELYEMLVKFKEMDANGNGDPNDEVPLSMVGLTTTVSKLLLPAFTGLPGGMTFDIDKNGEVVYIPAMDEYKEFLKYTNKLYSEGLIDPEFSSQTSQQWLAKVKNGTVGVYSGSPTALDPETTTTEQLSLPPLTSATNDTPVVMKPDSVYTSRAIITDKCENPEAAIRMLDMFYAMPEDEADGFSGQTLFLGYENEHWKYADDKKESYEWIAPITGFADINASISVNMELPGRLEFFAKPVGYPLMEMKIDQVNKMQKPYYKESFPKDVRYTEAESAEANIIENDLYSVAAEWTINFINGNASIEKDYDTYLNELKAAGLEELIEIKAAALDRWNEAMK